MGKMGHIPKHNVLLLHALIVFVIAELPAGSEYPGDIFVGIGPADRHVVVGEIYRVLRRP